MANNIEWSHAIAGADLADPYDLPEPIDADEIALWLGSDAAAVIYGTPEQLIALAESITRIATDARERTLRPSDA